MFVKRSEEGIDICDNYIEVLLPKHKGLLSSHSINYAEKFGVTNPYRVYRFINNRWNAFFSDKEFDEVFDSPLFRFFA